MPGPVPQYKKRHVVSGNVSALESLDPSFKCNIEIDAFKNLYLARTGLAKLIWLVIIVTFVAVLLYYMSKTVMDYIEAPASSSIKITTAKTMFMSYIHYCKSHKYTHEVLTEHASIVATAQYLAHQLTFPYSNDPMTWFSHPPKRLNFVIENSEHLENRTFTDMTLLASSRWTTII